MKSISEAFDSFAHALRLNTEHLIHAPALMKVDPQEAAGNLDTGLSAVLNGFHSIYDAAQAASSQINFPWNKAAPTATLLAIRNARHHNHAHRIRSMETYFTRPRLGPLSGEFGLVTYGAASPLEQRLFVQALSWQDVNELLNLPHSVTRLNAQRAQTINDYLGGDTLTSFAASRTQEVPVFFDMLPIITNAAKAAVRVLEPEIEVLSMEGRDFLAHFNDVGEVDMAVQQFRRGTFEI
ncbi:hypothetical protein [Rhizobium sp. RCC_161_2]|uniref:hypothetical protein n=1 Tax=Rhizobium sp. RCC_161_2 TaxID=3239219 RepID=UPI0035233D44